MARSMARLLAFLLTQTLALRNKKTIRKPGPWTYLERFCFAATPDGEEGDSAFELEVKHRGGSLLLYFDEGHDAFSAMWNRTFSEYTLAQRYAKATVAYDFAVSELTKSTKKSSLIARSPRFVYIVWANYNIDCNDGCCESEFRNVTGQATDAASVACDLEYENRRMGPTDIEYDFHLTNGEGWTREFSADEDALPAASIILLSLQTLVLLAAYRVRKRLEAGGKLHLTTRILTEAVAFDWVALLLRTCYYLSYQAKGNAPQVLDTLSRVCRGVADVEIVILLVLLGKGWTLVRHKLRVASRCKLAGFAATYALASFACLAWSQRISNDVEVHFAYAGSTGLFLAVLRIFACGWFLKAISDTIKHFPAKRAFCRVLRATGCAWLLATPLVIFAAHLAQDAYRREVFEIGESVCFFLGQAGLVALYALGGTHSRFDWFQKYRTEAVPKRSDALGAPPLEDRKFDLAPRHRLHVDDEFERLHLQKLGKVATSISERVKKLREESAALGDALASAFVPAKFDQDLRVRTPPRRNADAWRARDDDEAPRPLARSGTALDDALDDALPEYSSARRRLGSSKPAKIYT